MNVKIFYVLAKYLVQKIMTDWKIVSGVPWR